MRRIFPIIFILLFAALSGCITSKTPDENAQSETQKFEHANPNLDARIVEVKISPADVRAGEEVTADLIIANIGKEKITNETIDIKAKVNTLDDFVGSLALKVLSEDKKTRTYTMSFDEEIKPETVKPLSAVFHTVQEMQGRNLAGTYAVTITLSVNGQKVESRRVPITLQSGKPREPNETKSATTSIPTNTPEPTTTPTINVTPTPTPEPTPEEITVNESTGNTVYLRIMGWRFTESTKVINAGDKVLWDVIDDDTFTIADMDGKLPNITVSSKATRFFNTTGTYRFALYYPKMRTGPNLQTITVKLNATK